MNENKIFIEGELDELCELYSRGELSADEDRALRLILASSDSLTSKGREILILMEAERKIFGPQSKKRKKWWHYSWAAVIAVALGAIVFPLISHDVSEERETVVVWENGVEITGERAVEIAHEKQKADMEMIRETMKQQREMIKVYYASAEIDD